MGKVQCLFCLLLPANVLGVRNVLCASSDDVNIQLLVTALGLDLFGLCRPNVHPLYVYLRVEVHFYTNISLGKVRLI